VTSKFHNGVEVRPHPVTGCLVSRDGKIVISQISGKLVNPCVSKGYVMVGNLYCPSCSLHRLVFESWVGIPEKGLQINHIDGNKQNNDLSNLEAITASENVIHAYRLGLSSGNKGEDNSQAELKETEVLEMYGLFSHGYSNKEISERYGVHDRYVSLIRHGKRWNYLYTQQNKKFPDSFTAQAYSLDQILEAIALLSQEQMNKRIAEKTGIEASNISRLRSGKLWTTVVSVYNDSLKNT
jgi:hypothetical protein